MSEKMNKFVNTLAFAGLVLGAVALIVKTIFEHDFNIFDTILNILLFTVAGVDASKFTKGKEKWVNITYWVSIVLIVICIVLPIVIKIVSKN
jgi:hypothetical protein